MRIGNAALLRPHSSFPPPPPSLRTPPRLRSPAPAPPPPPPRARPASPQPPSSSSSPSSFSRRRCRGALPPGLARAPDAGERALGREEASPPPRTPAPPLRPLRGGQVEPHSESPQTAPAPRGPDCAACPRRPLPGSPGAGREPRPREGRSDPIPQSAPGLPAEIAAVIHYLLIGEVLHGA